MKFYDHCVPDVSRPRSPALGASVRVSALAAWHDARDHYNVNGPITPARVAPGLIVFLPRTMLPDKIILYGVFSKAYSHATHS